MSEFEYPQGLSSLNKGSLIALQHNAVNDSDIVLAERWQGLWAAKQLGLKVRMLQPPFKVSAMYMYLNKRHAALVPKVAKALVAMKQDGTFQRIIAETLKPLEVN